MQEESKAAQFEAIALPHFGAAYNLARWLVRDDHDAEDVVQEAYMRAFRFFGGYRGGDSRSWLLTIVRNTCYTWLQQNRSRELTEPIDDKLDEVGISTENPETRLLQTVDAELVRQALQELSFAKFLSCGRWKTSLTNRFPPSLICPLARSCRVWLAVANGCESCW